MENKFVICILQICETNITRSSITLSFIFFRHAVEENKKFHKSKTLKKAQKINTSECRFFTAFNRTFRFFCSIYETFFPFQFIFQLENPSSRCWEKLWAIFLYITTSHFPNVPEVNTQWKVPWKFPNCIWNISSNAFTLLRYLKYNFAEQNCST